MIRDTIRILMVAATAALACSAVAQDGASHAPGDRWRDCDDCPEMVAVPAGTFTMGSPASEPGRYDREGPAHQVEIAAPFAIGVYEVTHGEYAAFVRETNHASGTDSCVVNEGTGWEDQVGRNWRNLAFPQTSRHPAVCISWDDAQAFVSWLSQRTGMGYRLPSAAEWEHAARAGTSTPWYWGEGNRHPVRICERGRSRHRFPVAHRVQRRQSENLAGRLVPAQRLRPVRRAGQCLGVGAGLLQLELRRRPGERQCLGIG